MANNQQFTERQLGFAYWFVTHKPALRRLALGILIAFDVVTVGYGLYGLLDHYLISWNRDLLLRRNASLVRVSHEAVARLAPQPLNPLSVDVFTSGPGRFDFIAKLENPNPEWYANFRYQFVSANEVTAETSGFILPAEEKFIGQFAVPLPGVPRRAEFRLAEIVWHRVNRQVIRDFEAWRRERLNFILSNVTHTGALGIDRLIGRTSFDVENRTAFGYWRIGFFVALRRGTGLAAANHITLDNFDSGARRHVDVNWFEELPTISTVDVRPEVNLFDPDIYMPPRAR